MTSEDNRINKNLMSTKESSLFKGELYDYSSMDSNNDSILRNSKDKKLQFKEEKNSRSFSKRVNQKLMISRNLSQIKEESNDKRLNNYSLVIQTPKKNHISSKCLTTT
jgi:hypothetical protein